MPDVIDHLVPHFYSNTHKKKKSHVFLDMALCALMESSNELLLQDHCFVGNHTLVCHKLVSVTS